MKRTIKNDKNLAYLYKANSTFETLKRKVEAIRVFTKETAWRLRKRYEKEMTKIEYGTITSIACLLTGNCFPYKLSIRDIKNAYKQLKTIQDKYEK